MVHGFRKLEMLKFPFLKIKINPFGGFEGEVKGNGSGQRKKWRSEGQEPGGVSALTFFLSF